MRGEKVELMERINDIEARISDQMSEFKNQVSNLRKPDEDVDADVSLDSLLAKFNKFEQGIANSLQSIKAEIVGFHTGAEKCLNEITRSLNKKN